MRLVAFVGHSGSGKTTLLVRLIPELHRRGVRVSVLKHSHHDAFDREGSDTDRLLRAGALGAAIQGPTSLALFRPAAPDDPRELAALLPEADLVLCEGFKSSALPKVEVHRSGGAETFLCAGDPTVIAVVSDEAPPCALPRFAPEDIGPLADFLLLRLLPERRAP